MAITVRIPPTLRTATGGAKEVPTEGSTVAEVFKDLFAQYPDIERRVVGPDGQVHKYSTSMSVKDDIRFMGNLDAPVLASQEVSIMQAVAGG